MERALRIRKNNEFSRIINERHYFKSLSYVLCCSKKREDNSRVGISVSKKLGNAVVRNKIKRQVREMAKSLIDFKDSDYDYVLIVKKGYLNKDFLDNKKDLEKLIKKAIIS